MIIIYLLTLLSHFEMQLFLNESMVLRGFTLYSHFEMIKNVDGSILSSLAFLTFMLHSLALRHGLMKNNRLSHNRFNHRSEGRGFLRCYE